jgi:hypothetical protein
MKANKPHATTRPTREDDAGEIDAAVSQSTGPESTQICNTSASSHSGIATLIVDFRLPVAFGKPTWAAGLGKPVERTYRNSLCPGAVYVEVMASARS